MNHLAIIIFPVEQYCLTNDGSNLVQHKILFETKDGEGNCSGPGLLFYCKGMPANLIANQCTPLVIVNGARSIVHGVVPHPDGKFLIFCLK